MEITLPIPEIPKGLVAIVNAAGVVVTVPEEVLCAVDQFMRKRQSGSVTIQFKSGGVAGVETNTRQVLK